MTAVDPTSIAAPAAGVPGAPCVTDEAAGITAAFAAELRARHSMPECDRQAPMWLAHADI